LGKVFFVILSDRDLRTELAAGRIIIEPFDEACVQPSSIDIKVHNLFRVFRNHTAGIIDVKKDMTDLTELVDIPLDGVCTPVNLSLVLLSSAWPYRTTWWHVLRARAPLVASAF
jgi:deoxycytidine triphosphate deaminase